MNNLEIRKDVNLLVGFFPVVAAVFGVKCKQGIRPEYIAGCFSCLGKAVIDSAWRFGDFILQGGCFGLSGFFHPS